MVVVDPATVVVVEHGFVVEVPSDVVDEPGFVVEEEVGQPSPGMVVEPGSSNCANASLIGSLYPNDEPHQNDIGNWANLDKLKKFNL